MLGGPMVPVASTFTEGDGGLDRAAFDANVRAHLAAGLEGIVVAGSSGEAALLDEDERRTLVGWAREQVPEDRWLIAGVGGESTRITVARTRAAAEAGADAMLVVSPHYYTKRMSPAALLAHFTAVADASPRPVLLYNIPVYAHLALPPDVVATLAEHENVIGMKDSAGDLPMLDAYLQARSATFAVLTGSGATVHTALDRGASGAILAVALFAGHVVVGLHEAVRAGDHATAMALQERLVPLARDIGAAMGPAGLKAAMDRVGLAGGPVRSPLLPLDEAERARVRAVLAGSGLLDGLVARRSPDERRHAGTGRSAAGRRRALGRPASARARARAASGWRRGRAPSARLLRRPAARVRLRGARGAVHVFHPAGAVRDAARRRGPPRPCWRSPGTWRTARRGPPPRSPCCSPGGRDRGRRLVAGHARRAPPGRGARGRREPGGDARHAAGVAGGAPGLEVAAGADRAPRPRDRGGGGALARGRRAGGGAGRGARPGPSRGPG
jgi:4-hydroxy-2-oxoglutarate aldolase